MVCKFYLNKDNFRIQNTIFLLERKNKKEPKDELKKEKNEVRGII